MSVLYPKSKPENIVYYVRGAVNYRFSLPKLDENGKKIPVLNPLGTPIIDRQGNAEFIEEPVRFTPWHQRFTEQGYTCVYEVTKETPKRIADELAKDAADRKCDIITEEEYIRQVNPDLYAQIKKDASVKGELDEKDKALNAAKSELAKANELIANLKAGKR